MIRLKMMIVFQWMKETNYREKNPKFYIKSSDTKTNYVYLKKNIPGVEFQVDELW